MSDNSTARYSFVSWVRQGIGLQIASPDSLTISNAGYNERAQLSVSVDVNTQTVTNTVKLLGPGDIIGINPKSVVRTEPANWITNFEPNYLPYIEFYEEDLPWRYTPAKHNNQKLRPWLFLLVLEEGEFTFNPNPRPLPSITLNSASVLPPNPEQNWAWAHVHVNDELATDLTAVTAAVASFNTHVSANPDKAMSRLISPRMLKPNKSYHAFVIPAFETGRQAGLGKSTANIDAMKPSWGANQADHEFPVYYKWFFKTGATGDFEYLVRQLKPRLLDSRIGKRDMDIQDPGYGLNYTASSGVVGLEGALKVPGIPSPSFIDSAGFKQELQDLLNLSEDIQGAGAPAYTTNPFTSASIVDDPIVTPPMYGRWHAMVSNINIIGAGWVHQLNIDPRNRAAAGLGATVVQQNQEEFMDIAWGQVGEILEANKKLRQAELAKEVSNSLFRKHIQNFSNEKLMAITEPAQKRITLGTGDNKRTVIKEIKNNAQPVAVESPSYRKLTRPGSTVVKRVTNQLGTATTNVLQEQVIKKVYDAQATAAVPKTVPSAVETIDMSTIATTATNATNAGYSTSDANEYSDQITNGATIDLYSQVSTNSFEAPTPNNIDFASVPVSIKGKLSPDNSIASRITNNIRNAADLPVTFKPVMAAPNFPQPTYEYLKKLSPDYIIPNIGLIQNNTLAILETNQKFVEAYMAGLNHEMARELLWREFPTDQRGTYFKQFWDVSGFVNVSNISPSQLASITAMDTWGDTLLGTHQPSASSAPIVLFVRGDLLKKYPNTVIYAQRAKWQYKTDGTIDTSKPRLLETAVSAQNPVITKYPLFEATVEPDIIMLGFDLTTAAARGSATDPGWYFIIKERPGQVRFGLDIPLSTTNTSAALTSWNDVTWAHMLDSGQTLNDNIYIDATQLATTLEGVTWGGSSADMAYILYQLPVIVGVHGSEMLPAGSSTTSSTEISFELPPSEPS